MVPLRQGPFRRHPLPFRGKDRRRRRTARIGRLGDTDDGDTLAGQRLSDGLADAPAGAGDESSTIGKREHAIEC